MNRAIAIAAAVIVAAGLGATWYLGNQDADTTCSGSTVAGGDIGGPFELVNSKGETVTDKDVISEPTLLYFGYTFCPDVCPFDVARNVEAIDLLAEQGISATPIFITIDPERDTPQIMGDYEYNMHEKLIALTGTPEQVAVASKAYKTYYKAQKDGSEEYLVDHSTFTYLVMPDRGFVEFFRRDTSAEDMATRTACFVENS